jgi:hypothetical protein
VDFREFLDQTDDFGIILKPVLEPSQQNGGVWAVCAVRKVVIDSKAAPRCAISVMRSSFPVTNAVTAEVTGGQQ